MIKLGRTTPAIQGSKYTSISCSPRKYQGALEGLGVLAGFAGSSSGALITMDHTVTRTMTMSVQIHSFRTRKGQTWTRSSSWAFFTALVGAGFAFAGGAAGAAFTSAIALAPLGFGIWDCRFSIFRQSTIGNPQSKMSLEGSGDASVLPNAPEMHNHEQAGQDRKEDAVQDVEPEQGRRGDNAASQQEGPGVIPGRDPDHLGKWPLVAQQGRGPCHVRPHSDGPHGELVPFKKVTP